MRLIQNLIAIVVAALLLGVAAVAAGRAIAAAITLFGNVDRQVAVVAAIVCAAALAAAWIMAGSVAAATRHRKAATLREEKTATYQLLVDYWTNRLQYPSPRSDELRADFLGRLQALDRLLALYGAAPVIRAHTVLRESVRAGRPDAVLLQSLSDVLIAVRRDLGADTPAQLGGDLRLLLAPARPDVQPVVA